MALDAAWDDRASLRADRDRDRASNSKVLVSPVVAEYIRDHRVVFWGNRTMDETDARRLDVHEEEGERNEGREQGKVCVLA